MWIGKAWEELRYNDHRVIRQITGKHCNSLLWLFFRAATADDTMRFNTLFLLLITSCLCLALANGKTLSKNIWYLAVVSHMRHVKQR